MGGQGPRRPPLLWRRDGWYGGYGGYGRGTLLFCGGWGTSSCKEGKQKRKHKLLGRFNYCRVEGICMCDRHITGLRKQGGRGREDKEVVLNSKVLIHFRFFLDFFNCDR